MEFVSIAEGMPKYVCMVQIFPFSPNTITVMLSTWPSLWFRFWTYLFFGWKFEGIEK